MLLPPRPTVAVVVKILYVVAETFIVVVLMCICCGDPVSRTSVRWSDKSKALSEINHLYRRRCGEFTYVTYYCCVV